MNKNLINKKYYTAEEIEMFKFFTIPKALMNKKYEKLSFGAKFLYGLLHDRTNLSRENNWVDEEGRVFIYYGRERVMKELNIGKNKATDLFTELRKFNLIEEVQQGRGKPNKIYVLKFIIFEKVEEKKYSDVSIENTKKFKNQTSKKSVEHIEKTDFNEGENKNPESIENTKKFKNQTSRSLKSKLLEVYKSNPNNTEMNNTDKNKSVSQSEECKNMENLEEKQDKNHTKNEHLSFRDLEQIIKNNIEYDLLITHYDKNQLDELIVNMIDMYFSETTKINKQDKPRVLMEGVVLKLNRYHMGYILNKLDNLRTKVNNKKSYMQTMLYNAVFETDFNDKQVINEIYANGES